MFSNIAPGSRIDYFENSRQSSIDDKKKIPKRLLSFVTGIDNQGLNELLLVTTILVTTILKPNILELIGFFSTKPSYDYDMDAIFG